jgi:hypothetical protein
LSPFSNAFFQFPIEARRFRFCNAQCMKTYRLQVCSGSGCSHLKVIVDGQLMRKRKLYEKIEREGTPVRKERGPTLLRGQASLKDMFQVRWGKHTTGLPHTQTQTHAHTHTFDLPSLAAGDRVPSGRRHDDSHLMLKALGIAGAVPHATCR